MTPKAYGWKPRRSGPSGWEWDNFGKTVVGVILIGVGAGLMFFKPDWADRGWTLIIAGAAVVGVGVGHKAVKG